MATSTIFNQEKYLFRNIERYLSGDGTHTYIESIIDVERTDGFELLGVIGFSTSNINYPLEACHASNDRKKVYVAISSNPSGIIPSSTNIKVSLTLMYGKAINIA